MVWLHICVHISHHFKDTESYLYHIAKIMKSEAILGTLPCFAIGAQIPLPHIFDFSVFKF